MCAVNKAGHHGKGMCMFGWGWGVGHGRWHDASLRTVFGRLSPPQVWLANGDRGSTVCPGNSLPFLTTGDVHKLIEAAVSALSLEAASRAHKPIPGLHGSVVCMTLQDGARLGLSSYSQGDLGPLALVPFGTTPRCTPF